MDLGLRDRVALVTGASKGIGRAVALALRSDRHIRMARAAFLTGICITVDGGATRGVYP